MVNASLSAQTAPTAILPLEAAAVIGEYPGAAILVAADGTVLDANGRSAPLIAELERLKAIGRREGLSALIRDVSMTCAPLTSRILVDRRDGNDAGQQAFDLTLLPLSSDGGEPTPVLILGTEATMQRNLTRALKSSRDLFRDLVLCSSDFAWETDRSGVFVYVGPHGAAGYAAESLHGRNAFCLQTDENMHDAVRSIFLATEPVENVEIWLDGADGEKHCFGVSAVPVFDASQTWCGARGVGRDITAMRLQQKALAENQARAALVRSIIDTIRQQTDPDSMLRVSADSIGLACHAESCWVLTANSANEFQVIADHHQNQPQTLPEAIRASIGGRSDTVSFEMDGRLFQTRRTTFQGFPNGAVCIAQRTGEPSGEDVRDILEQIAPHAAVVLEHARNLKRLVELSRTDDLTHLPNRRAFEEDLSQRLAHHRRHDRQASMLYLDIDNFKQINDQQGHAKGDELLRTLSDVLRRTARTTDLMVRFGGDEFGLFLDETDESGARQLAQRLMTALAQVPRRHGDPALSISLGLATWNPRQSETMAALIDRADAALYEAKREGKGRFVIAAPVADGVGGSVRKTANGAHPC